MVGAWPDEVGMTLSWRLHLLCRSRMAFRRLATMAIGRRDTRTEPRRAQMAA